MADPREEGGAGVSETTPPPSPSPPRSMLATPVPSSPSPRPNGNSSGEPEALGPIIDGAFPSTEKRQVVRSHFRLAWRQNQQTGLMTLVAGSGGNNIAPIQSGLMSDDSDNDEEKEFEGLGHSTKASKSSFVAHNWRNKERMRTMGVAIALCLNLGTDPPDSDKVPPCARTECGIDPTRYHIDAPAYAVLKMIGTQLEEQFRNLQPRAKIKLAADPTVDLIRKTCTSLRKLAKNERVLVHFNGHGVPRPTRNGEIWAFNDDFTQYIPLSIFDLIRWTGHPSMFTFDCQSAGQLIPHFLDHERDNERKYRQQLEEWKKNRARRRTEQERRDRRERENERLVRMARTQNGVLLAAAAAAAAAASATEQSADAALDQPTNADEEPRPTRKKFIVLVPCGADEALPSSPQYPADLFTCCLTIPIQTALRWFILQNRMTMDPLGIEQGMVNLVPGKAGEKRSMLGELNWIFTAVTDTIAWSVLPRKLFQRLFRQDLLVASMLRHFLLAERIFRTLGCTPQSIPALPPTWKHRMWDAWDQAVERCLVQLPSLIPARVLSENGFQKAARVAAERQALVPRPIRRSEPVGAGGPMISPSDVGVEHEESRFFKDQLQAFEMWLSLPWSSPTAKHFSSLPPPEQLPVVLQVLLSHQHRFVALDQLARFLDLGPWAVSHVLSVGIFPYVLKLLQSPVPALKSFLVRIWVRILDLDPSCRDDLNQAKEQGYFIRQLVGAEDSEHASRAALVLCISCEGDVDSKVKCLSHDLDRACLAHLVRPAEETPAPSSPTRTTQFVDRARPPVARKIWSSESEDGDSDSENSDDRPSQHFQARNGSVQSGPRESSSMRPSGAGANGGPSTSQETVTPSLTKDVNLIRWSCLTLAKIWDGFELGRARALNFKINKCLERLLSDDSNPGVREASAHALGMLLGPLYADQPIPAGNVPSGIGANGIAGQTSLPATPPGSASTEVREEKPKTQEICDFECDLAVKLLKIGRLDGSPLVRREILFAVSRFVSDQTHLGSVQLTVHILSEFRQKPSQTQQELIDRLHSTFGSRGPKYMAIWLDLRIFAVDPFPAVSQTAQILIRFVKSGVQARIEAIRGRVGDGWSAAAASSGNSSESLNSLLLESDLFTRAKRSMCRCRQEVEDDLFQSDVKEAELNKRLRDCARAQLAWSKECVSWIGPSRSCDEWYLFTDKEEDELEDNADPRNLKAPFLQLLRSQQETENQGTAVGGGALTTGSAASPGTPLNISGASGLQGHPHGGVTTLGPAHQSGAYSPSTDHDLLRRFDQLPSDLFSSSNATRPLRRSSSFQSQSQLIRQSSVSLASNPGGGQSGVSTRLLNRDQSRSGSSAQRMEEVHRIEFGKQSVSGIGVGSAALSYVAGFHPFSPHLFVANQQSVSCYDCSTSTKQVTKFSNLNIAASTIGSLTWIDAMTDPLLLTCADDGHVRVWRDATTASASLVTAFSPFGVAPSVTSTALSAAAGPDRRGGFSAPPPLVEWMPEVSQLLCTSSMSSSLRVWDLVTEKLVCELVPSPSSTSARLSPVITCLSSSEYSSLFCVSYSDGTCRVFDRRTGGHFNSFLAVTSTRGESVAAVSKISRTRSFATAGVNGEVKLWDIRRDTGLVNKMTFKVDSGTDHRYAFHPDAPLLACAARRALASAPPAVKVLSLDDVELCQLKVKPISTSGSAFNFMGSSKQYRDTCALTWHSKEIALLVGHLDFATVHVAPNTRVRGVWSPTEMQLPNLNFGIAQQTAGGMGSSSHHSNSNISAV